MHVGFHAQTLYKSLGREKASGRKNASTLTLNQLSGWWLIIPTQSIQPRQTERWKHLIKRIMTFCFLFVASGQ